MRETDVNRSEILALIAERVGPHDDESCPHVPADPFAGLASVQLHAEQGGMEDAQ